MSGSAQAANLTGMLSQLANTVGGMGEAHNYLAQNIRDHAAPELDQNDPASMLKYAQWAQNNGQQDLAIKMQGAAAARTRQNKQTQGMAAIQGLRAQLEANRATLSKEQIIKIETQMAQIGANAELTPEQMTAAGLRSDNRLDAANAQANTVRGLDQVDTAQNDLRKYQDESIRVQDEELARLERQRADQVNQFGQTLDFNIQGQTDNYNLESAKIQNTSRSLDLTEDMNIANIERLGVLNDVNLREASDMEIRTGLFEAYQADQISTNALARILMGDQNARANELAPLEQAVLKARIQTAAVQANLTKAQTAQVYEAVGLAQDSRGLIVEGLRLSNLFKEVQTDLVGAQVENTEWNTDYIRTNIDAVKAQMQLDGEKFDFLQRSTKFDQDLSLGKLRLEAQRVGIDRDRADATAAGIFENIRSSQFRDEMLAVNTMAGAVSPLFNLAMNADIDVSNTAAVANGRLAFIEKTGSPAAGAIYDDAMKRRIEVASMQQDLSGRAFNKENTQAPTVARLTGMGMPEERAEQIMALSDMKSKDQAIQTWIQQVNTAPDVAEPSQQMMDMYMPTAKKLKHQVFGGGLGFGWQAFSTGINDGVIDDDVWQASARAMARAVSSGLTDADVMLAGISAMMPYAIETGDTGVVGTVYNLQQGLEE
jgi:hypothetical protein